MMQQIGEHSVMRGSVTLSRIAVEWGAETNEQGGPMRWLGSWLVRGEGVEGEWFYGGHGGERTEHDVPASATAVRVRRWTSEGLDPEYVDIALNGEGLVRTADLDFDVPQPHRVLRPSHS
jgi:hypothetical protein